MRRVKQFCLNMFLLAPIFLACFFVSPGAAKAEKLIILSTGSATVEVGKEITIPVYMNTDGNQVGAVGFTVNFPTENIEGLVPNRAGSVFNMWATETSTKIECGVTGQLGYSGTNGLITTLRFKGRLAGDATISLTNIKVYFKDASIGGFTTNEINLTVFGEGSVPEDVVLEPVAPVNKVTLVPPTISEMIAPSNTTPVSQSNTQGLDTSTTFGSKAQVSGSKGSEPEEPLQAAVAQVSSSIKGIFSTGSLLWSSILPTSILLIIIIILGIKLYLNERRRHAHLERIMHKQLGTLSALESKIEILDQKGNEGKEQYLKELEAAKADIGNQANDKNVLPPASKAQPTA